MYKQLLVIVSLLISDQLIKIQWDKNPLKKIYQHLSILKKEGLSVKKISDEISLVLINEKINFKIYSREKKACSIYQKMLRQKINAEDVYDILGLMIIVDRIDDCYRVLNLLHKKFQNIPEKLYDYIKNPKVKNHTLETTYRAIHTILLTNNNNEVEIQIKTKEMMEDQNDHIAYKTKQNEHISSKICPTKNRNGESITY
jgi:(p)ppGpp synthase/HD superfamily hydrolase